MVKYPPFADLLKKDDTRTVLLFFRESTIISLFRTLFAV